MSRIEDTHIMPPNYFPGNDIASLDAGSWDIPSKMADRSGKAVSETQQPKADGSRVILAAIDFHREEHVAAVLRQTAAVAKGSDTVILFNVLSSADTTQNAATLTSDQRVADMSKLAKQLPESLKVLNYVVFGRPEQVLLEAAAKQHCDLIILGKRKLGGLKKLTTTSVSNAIIQAADCSVLIAK